MAAAGVVGSPATELDGTAADIFAALALFAEAIILELQHGGEGEGVVGAGDVDVLRPDPSIRPQDLPGIIAGDGRDRPVLVVHVEPRLVAAADNPADQYQRMLAVAGALRRGHDDCGRIVGLDAAIQEVQRLADKAAAQHILDRKTLPVIGLGVVGGVVAVCHLDHRDLLGLGAVIVHVTHKGRREALPGTLPAVSAVVQHVAANRGGGACAGAADADLRIAVHRPKDRYDLAATRLDEA